ncbi:MAG: bifunctional diaminohydroxyphosphoribosylaminopyrimidine deaminase/5-amino-6-(5-phosphoribosylamino)uracil reductase RibD [Myxococcota bacterium]
MNPEAAMRLALAQARRASGRSFPNPAVGAIVYRGDRVLGRGCTRPAGGPHAEVVALDRALRRYGEKLVRGASLAVTLEPCCHVGRTGPCVDRVAAAGLRAVYLGHVDPHPAVSGRGIRRLRRAGIDTDVGILESECREQHRGFLSVCARGRPFVILKLASSLDGRVATASGESRWITGESARALVHRIRARVDAIVVGSGTALADDPELTARRGERVLHRPVRILVDSQLRVPATARLYRDEQAPAWILCARNAPVARRRAVASTGARLLEVPTSGRNLDLRRALAALGRAGLTEILVEGGGGLGAALLRKRLVDEIHWFVSARLIGGDGRAALGPLGLKRLANGPELTDVRIRRLADDVHIQGRLRDVGARGAGRRRTR